MQASASLPAQAAHDTVAAAAPGWERAVAEARLGTEPEPTGATLPDAAPLPDPRASPAAAAPWAAAPASAPVPLVVHAATTAPAPAPVPAPGVAGAAGIARLDRQAEASAAPAAPGERSVGADPASATFPPASAAAAGARGGEAGRTQADTPRPDGESATAAWPAAVQAGPGAAPGPASQGPASGASQPRQDAPSDQAASPGDVAGAPGTAQAAGVPVADAAAAMAFVADVGRAADGVMTALPQAAAGARAAPGPGVREAGASRKGGAVREAGPAGFAAGRSQEPVGTAYGAREQAGSLFAEGEAIPEEAATFLGLVLADGQAAFALAGAPANPLWAWALAGVLGDGAAPPLWRRLGMSPAELAAVLRDAPWRIVGAQLGRAIGQADLMALQTLPGPLAMLLGVGVAPRPALALQLGWEAVLLGGADPVAGRDLAPLWQDWGLESPRSLAALAGMAGAGRDAAALEGSAERPGGVASLLLGLAAAAGDIPDAVRGSMRALPAAALLGPAGLGGLHLVAGIQAARTGLADASGLVAVRGRLGGPVLIGRSGAGGLRMPDQAGLVLGGTLTLASGLAGRSPCVLAGWHGEQDAASLAALLLAVLPAAPCAISGAEWTRPLGEPGGWGEVRMANGTTVRVDAPADGRGGDVGRSGGIRTTLPRRPGASALLHLSGRSDAGHGPGRDPGPGFGAHVSHCGQAPVELDLAPVRPATPCWRLDDTRTLVEVGVAGAQSAALRAAELFRTMSGPATALDLLRPGEGVATWAGSPLWLALAGIDKPAGLGVALSETGPARVEVLHLRDGTWHVGHAGGGAHAPDRRLHPPDAAETSLLLMDVLYGLPGHVTGAAGRRALACFATARARTVPAAAGAVAPAGGGLRHDGDGASAARAWRARESWAAVARDWGRVVAALDGAPPGPPSAGGDAVTNRLLWDQVRQGRAMAAVWAMQDAPGGADALAALCRDPCHLAVEDGIAAALALCEVTDMAGAACLAGMQAVATTSGPDGGPAAGRHGEGMAAQETRPALWHHGAGVLARVSQGLVEEVSRRDGLALAVRLGRLAIADPEAPAPHPAHAYEPISNRGQRVR